MGYGLSKEAKCKKILQWKLKYGFSTYDDPESWGTLSYENGRMQINCNDDRCLYLNFSDEKHVQLAYDLVINNIVPKLDGNNCTADYEIMGMYYDSLLLDHGNSIKNYMIAMSRGSVIAINRMVKYYKWRQDYQQMKQIGSHIFSNDLCTNNTFWTCIEIFEILINQSMAEHDYENTAKYLGWFFRKAHIMDATKTKYGWINRVNQKMNDTNAFVKDIITYFMNNNKAKDVFSVLYENASLLEISNLKLNTRESLLYTAYSDNRLNQEKNQLLN